MIRMTTPFRHDRSRRWSLRALLAVVLLAASLVSMLPEPANALDDPPPTITIHAFDCSPDGATADPPVFTEDLCAPTDHAFAVTSPEGTTIAPQRITNEDGEVQRGPEALDREMWDEAGTWTITDLDQAPDTKFHIGCWTGNPVTGITALSSSVIENDAGGIEFDAATGADVTCTWYERLPADPLAALGAMLRLYTVPTAEHELVAGDTGETIALDPVTDEDVDLTVPVRLENRNGEVITFEADAEGTVLIPDGEWTLANEESGESVTFTTLDEGPPNPTIALIGVPYGGAEASGDEDDGTGTPTERASDTIPVGIEVVSCPGEVMPPNPDCDLLGSDNDRDIQVEVAVDTNPSLDGVYTLEDSGIGPRRTLDVPADATLTISVVQNIRPGYVPEAGFDPLVIAVEEVPEGGCGGEATCPLVSLVVRPAEVGAADSGETTCPVIDMIMVPDGAAEVDDTTRVDVLVVACDSVDGSRGEEFDTVRIPNNASVATS